MDICYVDEAGSAETLCASTPSSTPIFVIAGLIVPGEHLKDLQWDYLQIKKEFMPSLLAAPRLSDVIATQLKGSDLRADFRAGTRRRTRRAVGVLGRVLSLLEKYQCRIVGRVTVKDVDLVLDDRKVYTSVVSWMCATFHEYLEERDTHGLLVLDSRTKVKNTPNSAAIITQKFRSGGDPLPRLIEVPVFGHSDSHLGVQLADIVASAALFPAVCAAFCTDLQWNHHAHEGYESVRQHFGPRLKALQYRYNDVSMGHWRGGVFATGSTKLKSADMSRTRVPTPPLPFNGA